MKWETKKQLRARIAELEDAIEHTEKVNTAVNLLSAGAEPDGSFCIELQSKTWPLIAHSLAVWFESTGAKNYVEQIVDFEGDKRKSSISLHTLKGFFVITMQKKWMKSPHEFRVEAETQRDYVIKALKVITKTPHILAYLEKNDPKALEQARTALGEENDETD